MSTQCLSQIGDWLWIPGVGAQLLILYFMIRHKQRDEFPLFFHYTLLQIIATVALYPVYRLALHSKSWYDIYFYAYWSTTAVSSFLGFAVIHEIFKNAFKPYEALRDLAAILFRWATLVVLLVAVVLAFSSAETANDRLITAILSLERSILVMQGGVLLFLMLFSTRLGMSWKHHGFGIAMGFGVYACAQLVNNTLLARLGPGFGPTYSLLQIWLGAIQIAIWLGYLASPEPVRVAVASAFAPKPILERWNAVLTGQDELAAQGAFFVDLEKIVDHVMDEKKSA